MHLLAYRDTRTRVTLVCARPRVGARACTSLHTVTRGLAISHVGKCVKDVRTGLQNASSHFVDETILSLSLLFALPLSTRAPPPAPPPPRDPCGFFYFSFFSFAPVRHGARRARVCAILAGENSSSDRSAVKKTIRRTRERETSLPSVGSPFPLFAGNTERSPRDFRQGDPRFRGRPRIRAEDAPRPAPVPRRAFVRAAPPVPPSK